MKRKTLCFALVLLSAACGSGPNHREYRLQGQVLSIAADHTQAHINHQEIRGFMPAMAMPYKVSDPKQLDGVAAGDLIDAKLVVISNDAYLTDVRKVGTAPLTHDSTKQSAASSRFELLREGQPVPNAAFIDQDGRDRDIESFRGSAVLLTFIYTQCPMPAFCPLMDRHFAALQSRLQNEPALNARLVTVSFDPVTDTPAMLKTHAAELGADPRLWTFLTGDRDAIDRFAASFGVSVTRASGDPKDITHNLRTAIIDRQGNLVKVYTGNEWTPDQALADIKVFVGID